MLRCFGRPVGPVLTVLTVLMFGVGTVQAAPQSTQRLAPVMVVLDASGSMKQQGPDGRTRMDVAKSAMNTLIDDVPAGAEMGLTVYGTETGQSPQEKDEGCRDVRTVRPVGEIDKPALRDQVAALSPSGYTPIGKSLRHAAEELPEDEERAVVLISDGNDTCAPPPPCAVAKELDSQGVDLVVHTVGFKVGDEARSELECVAENTGGTYTEAPDSDSLEEALPRITERALRTYEAQGRPVSGTASSDGAPELGPGQWVDSISLGETLHYRLSVPENMTARIAATEVVPAEDGMSIGQSMELSTELRGSEQQQCESGHGSASNRWSGPITAALAWANDGDSRCVPGEDNDVEYTVERHSRADVHADSVHTLELLVVYEPPTEGDTGPASVDQDDLAEYSEPDVDTTTRVSGGGSFNSAPDLDGSGHYRDTIKHGEWVAYRVPVSWGQALTYQVEVGSSSASDPTNIRTRYYTPDRATPETTDGGTSDAYTGGRKTLDPVRSPRVLYNNRDVGLLDRRYADLAGQFYITVRLANAEESAEVPVDLKVNIAGEEIDGPDYAKVGDFPDRPVWTPQDSESAGKARSAAGAEEPGADGVPVWVWFAAGGGALAAVALVISGVVFLQRRGPTPSS